MTTTLPPLDIIRDLWLGLYGEDALVRPAAGAWDASKPAVVARYVDDEGVTRRLVVCDLQLAVSAGAALSMIPQGIANEAVKAGKVPDNILANLHEVMNICVNLFADSGAGRLVLSQVAVEPVPAKRESDQLFDVEVPRYPRGKMMLSVGG